MTHGTADDSGDVSAETACAAGDVAGDLPAELDDLPASLVFELSNTRHAQGNLLNYERRRRIVPARLLRALKLHDHNRCRFPGCPHQHYVEALLPQFAGVSGSVSEEVQLSDSARPWEGASTGWRPPAILESCLDQGISAKPRPTAVAV